MMRQIRKSAIRSTKKRTAKKQNNSQNKSNHKGGAIYSFDLNDKIGGLPANIALNGTQDGDCPNAPTSDLGFTNYGLPRGGGNIKKQKNKKSLSKKNLSKKNLNKSKKSKKNKK